MTTIKLPPLPEPDMSYVIDGPAKYNADQMRAHAAAVSAADNVALREIVEGAAAADEFLDSPEAIYRLAKMARAALGPK